MSSENTNDPIAVVLLHGIGEQRPMATLRGFVTAVFDKQGYSKPDRLSELFEVRRLNVDFRGRRLHCYELYWAHLMQGSEVAHIVKWLQRLISTPGAELRRMARHLGGSRYVNIRRIAIALLALTAAAAIGVVHLLGDLECPDWGIRASLVTAALAGAGFLLRWLVKILVAIVGDAARYLDSAPTNVGVRQEIRRQCLQFLDALNKSTDPTYSRIILIGHSLGSVIAYDALKFLWAKMDKHAALTICAAGENKTHYNESLLAWLHGEPRPTGQSASSAQRPLFDKILLDAKTPWKISDLITVGSPLTHAPLLFAESTEDFERLKEQRELPTCPPERDYGSPYCGWEVEGENRFELHHAAPFAVVQWTNCYFDSDPVGGPLGPVLGCGIRDLQLPLPVPNKPSWRDHVRYWSMGPDCGGNTFSEEIHKLILDN